MDPTCVRISDRFDHVVTLSLLLPTKNYKSFFFRNYKVRLDIGGDRALKVCV